MNAMFSAHAGEGSRTLAHRPQRSRSRDTQSGENAEEESRYDGHPSDKQENGSVYRCILDARNIERHQSDDASQQGDGDENTERPSAERERNRFDQELSDDRQTAGA